MGGATAVDCCQGCAGAVIRSRHAKDKAVVMRTLNSAIAGNMGIWERLVIASIVSRKHTLNDLST